MLILTLSIGFKEIISVLESNFYLFEKVIPAGHLVVLRGKESLRNLQYLANIYRFFNTYARP